MSRVRTLSAVLALCCSVVAPVFTLAGTPPADAATAYAPLTPQLATITGGTSAAPWNDSQGDLSSAAYTTQSPGTLLPTYTPGGATTGSGATTEPNLAMYPGATSGTDGNSPYPSGVVGTPGPLDGYCGAGNNTQESGGSPVRQPANSTLPLAPAYFPHVVHNVDGSLTGYFDYRPKDADEAIVAATSTDDGKDWTYDGEALEQNPDYCPTADINDDGQGHPNVISVGGVSRLYTLQRPAGDNIGVGMLVHTLNPTLSDPLNGVPAVEKVGVDPDDFSSSTVTVATTGNATINLANPVGTGPEQLVAGGFVDLTQTPVPTASSVFTCTTVGAQSLSGCNAASGTISVLPGDLIEQVLGTVSANLAAASPATGCGSGSDVPTTTGTGVLPCEVPTGPNTTTGDGGLAGFSLNVTNANNLDMSIFNANAPNRAYIDGVAIYCSQANALPTTKIEDCTTGPTQAALVVNARDPITSDPIVPATAQQTSGLVAPDGIVGTLPSYPGAPSGATIVMYTEKVLNYYIVGYTGSKTTFSNGMSIPFTPFPNTSAATLGSGPSYTVSIGDATTNTIVQETCTGFNSSTNTLTGCTGGTAKDSISKNSYLGAPGAATVPATTLAQIGEGSATNAQKLFKNNEDLTVLRVAYSTDGINFSSAGLANNGIISGASNGASSYSDINNPSSTTSPPNLNAYATAGTSDAVEMRFVGSAGTILTNPDGTYGMFLSGAWAGDGDSDAFNQIFYATSTDGEHWSIPQSVISTDYTFSASYAQEENPTQPLGISAYYSGRAYGPSVVQNPDGSLTMVFAGYRLPSPVGTVGNSFGTLTGQRYTVGTTDPALYRNILVVTLQSASTPLVSTSTSVSSTVTSSTPLGSPVTYTATVTPNVLGALPPTGSVSFSTANGGISGCESVALDDEIPDTATCSTNYAGPIDDGVQATYAGDTNYSGSSSPTLTTTTVISSDNGTGVVGETVTYSATVADAGVGTPTPFGTVSFSDGTGAITSCNSQSLSIVGTSEVATCAVSYNSPTTDQITATYNGDQNTVTSTGTFAENIDQAATTTSVTGSDDGAGIVVGQPVTFTVDVGVNSPGTGTPAGMVTVDAGQTAISGCVNLSLSGGSPDSAQCSTTFTSAMSNQVTAIYSGDSNFSGSTSANLVEVVNPGSTTTAVVSANSNVVVGQPVTFTATVAAAAPSSGTPTGTVAFADAAGVLSANCTNQALTLVDSALQATCTVALPAALTTADAVSATYTGDANYTTSTSSSINESVNQAATTVTLSSSDNGAGVVVGQPVTYTAQVGVSAPGVGTPSADVSFAGQSGPISGCTAVTLSLGSPDIATCTTTYTGVTVDSVTASYSGDANFLNTDSAALSETVRADLTSTVLTATPDPTVTGQPVTLTANVLAIAPGAGVPTGSVTFSSGSTTLCVPVALNGLGSATCSVTYAKISGSPHTVEASYSGSSNDLSSTSNILSLAVTQTTAVNMTVSPSPTTYGHKLTLRAGGLPGKATGTVTFRVGSSLICQASVQGSSATCAPNAPFAPGSYTIIGSYSGDSTYAPSSNSAGLTVTQAQSAIRASATPASSLYGATVSIVAKNIPAGATGTVTFKLGGSTVCSLSAVSPSVTCVLTGPNVGTYGVNVSYSGDTNYVGSSATANFTVRQAPAGFVASAAPTTVTTTGSVTLSATDLPTAATGSVTFTASGNTLCVASVANGTGSCVKSAAALSPKIYHVSAKYSGDSNYRASTSSTSFAVHA